MRNSTLQAKSFDLAVRVVNLYKHLGAKARKIDIPMRLFYSATSIGANVSEAKRTQSKEVFDAKMRLALQGANASKYWLWVLYKNDNITKNEYNSIHSEVEELISLLESTTAIDVSELKA